MLKIPDDIIERAKQIDLYSFLRFCDRAELVHVSGDTYCTREHDSLMISNGKWYWFSRGVGGTSALSYLTKVKGYSLARAVTTILEGYGGPVSASAPVQAEARKELLLPEKNASNKNAIRYLLSRGIDREIIDWCIEQGLLYESKDYHNVVFVGKDRNGIPKYAAIRSTKGSFKRDATGSDKQYSFNLPSEHGSNEIHLFEAAIDLLSYATLLKQNSVDWKSQSLLSLSGIYVPKRPGDLPKALAKYISDHPDFKVVHLHLDNDEAGRNAAKSIEKSLQGHYEVRDEPVPEGKDVNDYLMIKLKAKENKER